MDHFGPSASTFDPERWLEPFTESSGPFIEKPSKFGVGHLSFGAGARACSGQIIASRLLYTALLRIISSYKIVASKEHPPNTDYVEYNEIKTALVAIPRDFSVRLIPRDGTVLDECLEAALGRTGDYYKEEL